MPCFLPQTRNHNRTLRLLGDKLFDRFLFLFTVGWAIAYGFTDVPV
ncbi:hypothetical protein [Tumidithrix helvetica]